MTAFTDLIGEVLSEAPGADSILILRSIRRAMRRFCEKTLLLEATTNPYLDVVANEAEYILPSVDNRDLVRIKRKGVWWGSDAQLVATSEDQLDRDQGNPNVYLLTNSDDSLSSSSILTLSDPWRAMTDANPVAFYQPKPNTIRLVPIPNASYTAQLGVTYHLKPSTTAKEVDDFIVESYLEEIVPGILAELLGIRNKPWTDLQLAAAYGAAFGANIARIVGDRVSGFASTDYSVGRVRAWT